MKTILTFILVISAWHISFGQNENLSNGSVFDGEPYLSINPTNSQHMVVAWMGYMPFENLLIKTRVTFDGGQSWSNKNVIPHVNAVYGSADPSVEFDNAGNVYIAYIDFNVSIDDGAVYIVKSIDGGLNWTTPVEVLNVHSDPGKYAIDRPWMSIDRSGGSNDGNIYITTMPPKTFGTIPPSYHPYLSVSTDGGNSFSWQYLDDTNWLSGNLIPQPMPTNCVAPNGTFYAVYPSYVLTQSPFPQFILAKSDDAGNSFSYNNILQSTSGLSDTLAKKGYLLRSNPSNSNHLAFFYLGITHGDIDVFMIESTDAGVNWTSPKRINDDPIGNDRMQDLIWADFDTDGDLVVSWRDRRNGSDSTYATSSEIWGAVRSKDSTNFYPNFKISDTPVVYDSVLALSGNDFMCVKLVDDTLSAVWGDTRSGKLNIWFQRMELDGQILSTYEISAEDFPTVQIFPNPSTSNINIQGEDLQKIVISNESGKTVLIQQNLNKSNALEIDINSLSKGTYFIRVTTKKGDTTKKIVKK